MMEGGGFLDTDIDIAELLEDAAVAWAEFVPGAGDPYSEEWAQPRENWREYENNHTITHGKPSFVENNGRIEYMVPVRYAHDEVDIDEWQGTMVLSGYIEEARLDAYREFVG